MHTSVKRQWHALMVKIAHKQKPDCWQWSKTLNRVFLKTQKMRNIFVLHALDIMRTVGKYYYFLNSNCKLFYFFFKWQTEPQKYISMEGYHRHLYTK